ncbi:MAG TPA: VCBS repeat-containing protein, partial [Thermoanaerobaculaceae bacterium]|nr:VCBS repeat-containing protein [Thermoanaerobaculaceae bacterium]
MRRTAGGLTCRDVDCLEGARARRDGPISRRASGSWWQRRAAAPWGPSFALATALLTASAGAASVLRNPMPIPIPLPGVSFMLGADFNADGHEDLLLVDPGRSVAVLLDNGTGPFAAPVVSALPYGTARPGVGDVDGDGIPDLVVSDYTTATGIVMLGHGDGSFTTGSSFGTVTAPGPIALADFNGDGWLDVAVASANTETTKNIVSVHLGDGTGHFTSGPTTTIKWLLPRVIAPVDMNLDGTMDLVASDPLGPTLILLGDGLGGFTSAGTMAGGEEIVTGDFNHDGVVVGVIQTLNKRVAPAFTTRDEQVLAALAAQAGVALENAKLLQRDREHQRLLHDLELARAIQLGLLPTSVPTVAGWR